MEDSFFAKETRRLSVVDVLKRKGREGLSFRRLAEATGIEDSLLVAILQEMREVWDQIEQRGNRNYRLR